MFTHTSRWSRFAALLLLISLIPSSIAIASCTVTISGPTSARNQVVTVTAALSHSGYYYYQWEGQYCHRLNRYSIMCELSDWYGLGSGYDLTSASEWVDCYTKYQDFKVTVLDAPGGNVLAIDTHRVTGAAC